MRRKLRLESRHKKTPCARRKPSALLPLWLCLFLLSAGLAGCSQPQGGVLAVNCVSQQNSTSFSARYDLLSGEKKYEIRVNPGETLALRLNVTTEEGSLAASVSLPGQEPAYTGNALGNTSFTVYLRESGTYTVRLTAEKHRGSYSFAWD